MGIAWFDDDPPDEAEAELRTGGRPLLAADTDWPSCPRCGLPMLFRAQVPLAMTSLVPYDDDRLAALFECHAVGEDGPCTGAAALIGDGDAILREPPPPRVFDVWLRSVGADETHVRRVLEALDLNLDVGPPIAILHSSPSSIARATFDALKAVGADVELRSSPPTLLSSIWGGRMVPFDDGGPGVRRTTLPPLPELMTEIGRVPMRGIFGGATPGYRDHAFTCRCGASTRTAVRLLAVDHLDASGATLGPSTLQFCSACGHGSLLRMHGPRRLAGPHPGAHASPGP